MLHLDKEQTEHIENIDSFLQTLMATHGRVGQPEVRKRALPLKLRLVCLGIYDYLGLVLLAIKGERFSSVVFVTKKLVLYEKRLAEMDLGRAVFINYHQTEAVGPFDGNRVFNIGLLVGVAKRLSRRRRGLLHDVCLFNLIHRGFQQLLQGTTVYIPCYYDANGLALVVNDRRGSYELVEVQHGGICNFEPYTRPVSFRVSDRFVVADNRTAGYLRAHLYRRVPVNIEVATSDLRTRTALIANDEPVVLYCSSIEVNGLHEKFVEFLRSCGDRRFFELRVRLHPRESDRKEKFITQFRALDVEFEFDESPDWLAGNPFQRLIVVSPWSSVIEEAYREGICSVVLDDFGRERFEDLIDGNLCWFAENVCTTFADVFNRSEAMTNFGSEVG